MTAVQPAQLVRPAARIGWVVLRGLVLGLVLALLVEAGRVMFGPNIHTVLPGRVYRCAQLSAPRLEKLIHTYGIRTVVNLRGFSAPLPWYLAETTATHALNVSQEDISFSAGRIPPVHEFRRLVRVLDETEYPILLHCRQGADRTGVAAAVVLLLQTDQPLAQARRQLGLRYGHVALDRAAYLDHFLDLYAAWLGRQDIEHSPAAFRRWVDEDSFPGECQSEFQLLAMPRPVSVHTPFGVQVRVRNHGLETWHFSPNNTAGHHLVFVLSDMLNHEVTSGRSGLFDAAVGPGEQINLTVPLPGLAPGQYQLRVDMLEEKHCWFSQAGSEPLEVELVVHE